MCQSHVISQNPDEPTRLSNQRLDTSLEGGRVGTDDVLDLFAALEQNESGHGTDAQLGRDVAQLVDVDLIELGLAVGIAELLDLGGDGLARPAPGCEAVENDGLLGVDDLLIELSTAGSGG